MMILVKRLLITFCAVMGFAEHFAVVKGGRAALAPCGDMVCVHLSNLVDACAVGIIADRTERTVGDSLGFCLFCLTSISEFLGSVLENADMKEFRMFFGTENIFIYIGMFAYGFIGQ